MCRLSLRRSTCSRALALDTANSIEARDSLEKMLTHELALTHRLVFDFANRAAKHTDANIAVKLMNVSARMMDTFQRGLLTIQKLRSGNSQTVTVQHVHVHGGQTVVAGTTQTGGRQEKPGSTGKKWEQPHTIILGSPLRRQDAPRDAVSVAGGKRSEALPYAWRRGPKWRASRQQKCVEAWLVHC